MITQLCSSYSLINHLFFIQIPYYIDDDVKLSQTFAILKYLGRKHGLVPLNEAERIRIDLIEAEALDMRQRWVSICYGKEIFVITKK